MRTDEEIQEEIRKLKEMEPNIRPYSIFGDDNKAQLRAEIKVLEDDMSEDEIYDLEGIVSEDTLSGMLNIRDWLDGEEDDLPSEGWESLVQKPKE